MTGFDAPVCDPADDHLGRWPLAREIYSVAVNGPLEWPVRIGVYGQWGTGKTSVLEFIASMASKDGHIVTWFDPWAFSSKSELWKQFVLAVCHAAEDRVGGLTAAGDARLKGMLTGLAGLFKPALKFASEGVQESVSHGLSYLKKLFEIGAKDIAKLKKHLGDHRILVLIDDLDRTAPELVPEILFALKEVMTLPGFAFVCGFDPAVVGKVLGNYHPGFGDGLQFLEKIIDYPVHLPPVTNAGLTGLALADGKVQCSFVPENEIRNVLPLLPQNPRAIRQFIRMLALLRTQIERHYEYELRWPVIIAAAVLRLRYPEAARSLFNDHEFWMGVQQDKLFSEGTEEKRKVNERITEAVRKVAATIQMSAADDDAIQEGLRRICEPLGSWLSTADVDVFYQLTITESPHAITWKEFDQLLEARIAATPPHDLAGWIALQAEKQHRKPPEVGSEIFAAALERYGQEQQRHLEEFDPQVAAACAKRAEVNLSLLEDLVRLADNPGSPFAGSTWIPLVSLIEKFAGFAGYKSHKRLWKRCRLLLDEAVLISIANESLVIEAVKPFDEWRWEQVEARKLHRELSQLVLRHFAAAAHRGFEESGFVDRVSSRSDGTAVPKRMILQSDSAFWKDRHFLAVLKKPKTSKAVQENAFALLQWFEYLLQEEKGRRDANEVEQVIRRPAVLNAIWSAATTRRFSDRVVYKARKMPKLFGEYGGNVKLPRWWKGALKSFEKRFGLKASEEDVNSP